MPNKLIKNEIMNYIDDREVINIYKNETTQKHRFFE